MEDDTARRIGLEHVVDDRALVEVPAGIEHRPEAVDDDDRTAALRRT
jgi:hypothetical protein